MCYWKDNPEEWYRAFTDDNHWSDLHGKLDTATKRIEQANHRWEVVTNYADTMPINTAHPSVVLLGFIYIQRRLNNAVTLINNALPYSHQNIYEGNPIMGHSPTWR